MKWCVTSDSDFREVEVAFKMIRLFFEKLNRMLSSWNCVRGGVFVYLRMIEGRERES